MEYVFNGLAYLKASRLDQQGCESVTYQFDASQQVELAKMKLMGRDLTNFSPVLLEVRVKVAKKEEVEAKTKYQV